MKEEVHSADVDSHSEFCSFLMEDVRLPNKDLGMLFRMMLCVTLFLLK